MMMKKTLLLAIAGLLLSPSLGSIGGPDQSAQADIVVLNNGFVVIGKIRDREFKETHIVIRKPYPPRHIDTKMKMTCHHGNDADEIRYVWRNPNPFEIKEELPVEYWQKFTPPPEQGGPPLKTPDEERYPIRKEWLKYYEKYKESLKEEDPDDGLYVRATQNLLQGKGLSAVPFKNNDPLFLINFPGQWRANVNTKNDIVVATSPKLGAQGFRPTIHVFAVERVKGKYEVEQQVEMIFKQIQRVGEFEWVEKGLLKTQRLGAYEVSGTSKTTIKGMTIWTKRKIYFREKYTYFFVAHAHERNFDTLKQLFEASLRTLKLGEDMSKRKRGKK